MKRTVFIDDEDKNVDVIPLNSHKISTFTGDKKDK
jgi:hypothetical protein